LKIRGSRLGLEVWTRGVRRALCMARKLQFGTVWINMCILFVNEMPHGGYKQSTSRAQAERLRKGYVDLCAQGVHAD
jgi:acyl-CoA reductase-like NAD-dependent aldehyde dehydrogenase